MVRWVLTWVGVILSRGLKHNIINYINKTAITKLRCTIPFNHGTCLNWRKSGLDTRDEYFQDRMMARLGVFLSVPLFSLGISKLVTKPKRILNVLRGVPRVLRNGNGVEGCWGDWLLQCVCWIPLANWIPGFMFSVSSLWPIYWAVFIIEIVRGLND